jgi:hypothetical protein
MVKTFPLCCGFLVIKLKKHTGSKNKQKTVMNSYEEASFYTKSEDQDMTENSPGNESHICEFLDYHHHYLNISIF